MKKFFKWLGIILGLVVVGVAITAFVLVQKLNGRMEKTWQLTADKLEIPTDSVSIKDGQHFIPLCQSCHGEALEGKVFFTDPKIGTIYSPNLTKGEGGIGGTYTDKDWILALRHGVNPAGKSLFIMPSKDFNNMSAKDLGNLIAYLKTLPAVDNAKGVNELPAFTKILMQVGAFGIVFPSEEIDHNAGFKEAPVVAETKEYGKYLESIIGCTTCHGPQMAGGKSPDPNSPMVSNITVKGNLGQWTDAEFISTMRTGVTPEKRSMDDKFMPWKHIGQMSDTDLKAILAYLKSLPGVETPKS